MDYATKIKPVRRVNNAPVPPPRRMVKLGFDVPLLLVVITLLIFGAVMVFSASWDYSKYITDNSNSLIIRQLQVMGIGLVAAVIMAFVPYKVWQKLALPAMLFTIILLIAVLLFGEVRYNARRALFGGSFQPLELAKLMTIIYLSVWLFTKKDRLNSITLGLFPLIIILGIIGGLIALEPDYSTVLTILALGGMMFFLAGGEMRQIFLLVGGAAGIGFLIMQFTTTGQKRVADFLLGLENPLWAPDHVRRTMEAFINGGWFGLGIGKSQTKLTSLPWPHTDSIFAVVGEETGVLGSVFVVVLFGVLLWRALVIADRAPDMLGKLLAGGIGFWIAMEAAINILVVIGLGPFAGNALPLISYGGSNLLVMLVALGLLMNVSMQTGRQERDLAQSHTPIVDYRSERRQVPRRVRRET